MIEERKEVKCQMIVLSAKQNWFGFGAIIRQQLCFLLKATGSSVSLLIMASLGTYSNVPRTVASDFAASSEPSFCPQDQASLYCPDIGPR
jgi:hypothetical protein